jgi:hypothetical protein
MKFASIAARGIVLLALLSAAGAQAQRQPVPVINYENQLVARTDGKSISAGDVRQAIQNAASAHQWRLAPAGDSHMQATLVVRNKHTVVVDVEYGPEKFSVRYLNSINMKAGKQNGQDVIHPFYNRWVQTFLEAIRMELNRV